MHQLTHVSSTPLTYMEDPLHVRERRVEHGHHSGDGARHQFGHTEGHVHAAWAFLLHERNSATTHCDINVAGSEGGAQDVPASVARGEGDAVVGGRD